MKVNLKVPMSDDTVEPEPARYIPQVGSTFNLLDVQLAFELVRKRVENYPNEPANISLATVLVNMGDRYTPVVCIEGEWQGIKEDLIGMDPPKCPNGHDCKTQPPLQLVWAQPVVSSDEEMDEVPVK